jgi:hypothetical protein
MIASIGVIIGLYVIVRCLHMLFSVENRYSSKFARAAVVIGCAVTIAFTASTGLTMVGLLDGGGPLSDIATIVRALPNLVWPSGTSSAHASTPANEPTFTPAEKAKQRSDIQELIRKSQEGH